MGILELILKTSTSGQDGVFRQLEFTDLNTRKDGAIEGYNPYFAPCGKLTQNGS